MIDHPARTQSLQIYIGYQDFLTVEQLSVALSELDQLYTRLYNALDQESPTPLPPEARMRVQESRTGESILLILAEGVKYIFSAGGVAIAPALGIPAIMASVILGCVKPVVEIRKTWYEGSQAKWAAKKAQLETEKLKSELEKPEAQPQEAIPDLSSVPDLTKQEGSILVVRFLNLLEYSDNIRTVKINQITIIEKNGQK